MIPTCSQGKNKGTMTWKNKCLEDDERSGGFCPIPLQPKPSPHLYRGLAEGQEGIEKCNINL